MRISSKKILILSVASALLTTACSQSETSASFHQYGGSGGNSLGYHTLRKNETLWAVAKSYNVDLRDMLDLNQFSVPYKTYVGERIKIPAPATYKVRQGDTLYKVSRFFDTSTTDVARLNNIKAPYKLASGQVLRLPPRYTKSQNTIPTFVPQPSKVPSPVMAQQGIKTQAAKIEREVLKSNVPSVSAEPVPLAVTPTAVPAPNSTATAIPAQTNTYSPQPSIAQSTPEIAPTFIPTGPVHFIKPVAGQVISGFGPKPDGLHNDGINIKASQGDAVRAAEQGVVVYQGQQIEGYGNMVLIRHANGYLTAYAHMAKTLVHKGDKVKRGQAIGTVGASGNVKSPQLHFEIRKGRDAIDPKTLLKV